MARIRTVKPEFFRHEDLQDLEAKHNKKYPMLVFAGLWTVCDRSGRFEWRPRQLKLDILPFLNFDMAETLEILRAPGFIRYYEVDGKHYGFIPTFAEHQRITGKEAQSPERYPAPPETQLGNIGETPENHPDAQEREREREKEREKERIGSDAFILPEYIPEETWKAYLAVRKKKKAESTPYALKLIILELEKIKETHNHDPVEVLNKSIKSGWTDVYPLKEMKGNGNGTGIKPDNRKSQTGPAGVHGQSDGEPWPVDAEY